MLLVDKVTLMFFKRAAAKAPIKSDVNATKEKISHDRADVKRRLAEIEAINESLTSACKKAGEIATITAAKITNTAKKISFKYLKSITSKMQEGVILINYKGDILYINRAGAKIMSVDESSVLRSSISALITCKHAQGAFSENLFAQPDFFENVSKTIFEKIQDDPIRYACDSNSALCLDQDINPLLGELSCSNCETGEYKITFSMIENNPSSVHDVTYLFLFSTVS